jgi:hypothetical protein
VPVFRKKGKKYENPQGSNPADFVIKERGEEK